MAEINQAPKGDTDSDLSGASERIAEGMQAGNEYIAELEGIRDVLADDVDGATLGDMVAAQLKMTETETQYMVKGGLPKKASGAQQAAAQEVKKASG